MNRISNILLVDDNKMDIELTLDAFKEARVKNPIHVANDGEQALDYLFGRNQYFDREKFPLPDVVLLDLKMPKIDGFEVLRQIKSCDVLKRIPVIILTSSKEEGDRALSYDNGANSYLVKPVSFEGFLKVIKKVVEYWLVLNVSPPKEK
jgi:CheY-like chemotaxis protein